MSTKSSLAYREWKTPHILHIYHEMLDDCYYIETDEEKLKIPKEFAELFAKVMNEAKE